MLFMRKHFGIIVRGLLLIIGMATATLPAFSQNDSGQITGTVTDQAGKRIGGATLVIRNQQTGEERSITTNAEGGYRASLLKPARYTVRVDVQGFTPTQYTDIELAVGQERVLDFSLQVSSTSEIITVVGTDEPALDTTSARVGANVSQREVKELPLNGRQISQLYLQAPGAVNSGSGTFGDIRFFGRATEQNAIRYDGIEGSALISAVPGNLNGEIPSPFRLQSSLENVQEFRVDSSSYTAEFGTGTGGQVSIITKSGTNQFHGSGFEFLRNDVLDARNQFDRSKSALRLNQFGGSVGGPIIKNKAFFFLSYEGYRLRSGINSVEAVPSAAAAARAVTAIRPLIDAFRGPGAVVLPGVSTNPDFDIVQLNSAVRVDENSFGVRFDYKFNDRNTVYARYFRDQGETDQPEGVTGRRVFYRTLPQNGVLSLQSVITPNFINEAKFGYNGALSRVAGRAPVVNGIDLSGITINVTGSVANTGIAGQGATSGVAVPGGLIRGNSSFNGRGFPYTPYSLSYIDSATWTKGAHNIKFGGEIRQIRMYTDRQGGTTYTYANLNDFLANRLQQVQFSDDLSAARPFDNGAAGQAFAKQEYYIFYGQDEWRIRPNFTLSYGLRYEYYTPLREDQNRQVLFDLATGTLRPNTQDPYTTLKTNFQPRVSFAWTINPDSRGFLGLGKSVLRAGFGIYNGPGQTEDQIQPIESDRIATTITGGAFPVSPDTLRANFINNPQNRLFQPRAYAPDYKVPERTYNYTVSFQQELPYNLVATIGYVGTQGRNLFLRNFTNRITDVRTNPANGQAIVIRQFDIVQGSTILRPFAEIDFKTSGGSDRYDALQLSLSRRLSAGLTLNSQYTFGRSFGNTAGSNEAQTTGNPFDYNYDKGYNSFDVRHTFNLSAVYDLPFGKGRKFLGGLDSVSNALLGNWQVATIVNLRSGLPIDVRLTRPDVVYVDGQGQFFNSPGAGRTAVINTLGGGASRNVRRPDLIPGVNPFLDSGRQFLNPAAFAVPKPGTFGNLQRGALHGPNFRQVDLVLNKRFPIREALSIDFRAEFYNLFNFTNYANPVATLSPVLGTDANQIQPGQPLSAATAGNANFGRFTSTVERTVGLGTNRQIQFALRINF